LINNLIEYGQRCDLNDIRKMQARISYKDVKGENKHGELYLTSPIYILADNKLVKINDKFKFEEGSQEEFEKLIAEQKGKPAKVNEKLFEAIRREYGEFGVDF
jgi:hypothetical protein